MPHQKQTPQIISWQAPEFVEHERTKGWYIVFYLIAAALMVYAIYSRSIITIITFALLTVVALIFINEKPKTVTHSLTTTGIAIDKILYPYKNIKKFWIVYKPPEIKTLNFETTAYLNQVITLQLGSQDPVVIKLFLKNYLPEDLEAEESISDLIARKAKF